MISSLIILVLDVNECDTDVWRFNNSGKCVENAECVNKVGSYSCKCMEGFVGNGTTNCTGLWLEA